MVKVTPTEEKIVSGMEEKYGEEFRFVEWRTLRFGSKSCTAHLECDSLPGKLIKAGREISGDGDMIYFDNYMAYRYEDEIREELESAVKCVYPESRVLFLVPSCQFPLYMGPEMSAEDIFANYARHIGIGGIATAGVIGIIKSWGIIKGAVSLAANELKGQAGTSVAEGSASRQERRTQRDLSMKVIAVGIFATLVVTYLFFHFGVLDNWYYALIGLLIVGVIAFLFTTVAANAIAIVGTNPVSGMTLMTLILASIILVTAGLKGTAGMVSALIIGGVVCTALSMAGGFITDLKIGYWLGSTPAKQESWKFLGTLVSAATVGGVILILNQTYGFTSGQLAAPQANAMAAVIEPLMSGSGAPWALYAIGAVLAVVLNFCKIPALAFALGMFIPLELNTPLLIGGAINWYVGSRSKDTALNNARVEKGTLLASGFIAGGALMGVVSAAMRFAGINMVDVEWMESDAAGMLAIVVYLLLIGYLTFSSLKAKKE